MPPKRPGISRRGAKQVVPSSTLEEECGFEARVDPYVPEPGSAWPGGNWEQDLLGRDPPLGT